MQHLFKENKQWGKRDSAFIAENVYVMVRCWRRLCMAATLETPIGEGAFFQ